MAAGARWRCPSTPRALYRLYGLGWVTAVSMRRSTANRARHAGDQLVIPPPRFESATRVEVTVRRFAVSFAILAALLWGGASSASAAAACARGGERTLASNSRLLVLEAADRYEAIVCRRATGTRRTLARMDAACSHCTARIQRVALRGRFAHAVVSRRAYNDETAELVTLDTRTWRARRAALDLGDQSDDLRSDVTDLVTAAHGRVVLRVRNDFATGIVLVGPAGAAYLDEGLATAIGRPRVHGARAAWRHGAALRSSPTLLADRCPRAPAPPPGTAYPPAQILATADAVTVGGWYCLRVTGTVGRLDGSVVRLLGSLAVVQRPGDLRVIDLRTAATISGPAASDANARSSPGVGRSGTLVLRRHGTCAGQAEIVALAPGAPERRLACGDLRDVRYEDGVVRYRDDATGAVIRTALP